MSPPGLTSLILLRQEEGRQLGEVVCRLPGPSAETWPEIGRRPLQSVVYCAFCHRARKRKVNTKRLCLDGGPLFVDFKGKEPEQKNQNQNGSPVGRRFAFELKVSAYALRVHSEIPLESY